MAIGADAYINKAVRTSGPTRKDAGIVEKNRYLTYNRGVWYTFV